MHVDEQAVLGLRQVATTLATALTTATAITIRIIAAPNYQNQYLSTPGENANAPHDHLDRLDPSFAKTKARY